MDTETITERSLKDRVILESMIAASISVSLAVVIDVVRIPDRGFAVVEPNPVWAVAL